MQPRGEPVSDLVFLHNLSELWLYMYLHTQNSQKVKRTMLPTGRNYGRITQKGIIKMRVAGKICGRLWAILLQKVPGSP